MSARENILSSIALAKSETKSLPSISLEQVTSYEDPIEKFSLVLESIGGRVKTIAGNDELLELIQEQQATGVMVLDMVTEVTGNSEMSKATSALLLEPLDCAFIKARLGVAENGAIWIGETAMVNRLLPFICQHLFVVLKRKEIVSTMHHAYDRIDAFEEGFGVFIAGPSKTADIEQSLVIGAHGARSMTVLLVD